MIKGFKHILVPVYPLLHYKLGVDRAISLADEQGATIFMVNMLNPFLHFTRKFIKTSGAVVEHLYKNEVQHKYRNLKFVNGFSFAATIEKAIVAKAKEENIDMIIIAEGFSKWINANLDCTARLAAITGIPVLSAKKSKGHVTSIVIPVQQNVEEGILEKIAVMHKKSNAVVHLVTYNTPGRQAEEDIASSSVLQAYQWLKSYVNCPVKYSTLTGTNKTRAVENYLHGIPNDVVLIQ